MTTPRTTADLLRRARLATSCRRRWRPATATTAAAGTVATTGPPRRSGGRADIAARSGCAGCHGANGEGGVGPAWIGLLGSQVQLSDGTTVVADEAYLTSSIKDPAAQIVAGYPVAMPVNQLSDDDIAKIVAYIESLARRPRPPADADHHRSPPARPPPTSRWPRRRRVHCPGRMIRAGARVASLGAWRRRRHGWRCGR